MVSINIDLKKVSQSDWNKKYVAKRWKARSQKNIAEALEKTSKRS
jgi:hypothetical protein